MVPEITMKELIILVLCLVLYVVAVEVYEARESVARQGLLAPQEQSFNYQPPASPPVSDDGSSTIAFDTAEGD
jgi:hypothetical protein